MPTVYVTVPASAADDIATALVAERLAACVNRVPCRSTYRWEGDLHRDEEVVLLAKTTSDRYGALEDRVAELHPHDVPCIERFDAADVFAPYADWVAESVE